MQKHKPRRVIGPWNLTDLANIEGNGLKVFSCFHCGGGSTMGYKLAGFEVLGGVEIDPQMMKVYLANHQPKHSYLMGVQDFKKIPDADLPPALFALDILDGSPPCSSFSTAGSREKKWGDKHYFREGQVEQRLDQLFFDFIDVAAKLKPKVVIAENVRGLIIGNAKGYVKQIFAAFKAAGYQTKLFLLNASVMGVPQRRERTVFVAVRNDVDQHVSFDFAESKIFVRRAVSDISIHGKTIWLTPDTAKLWERCEQGNDLGSVHPTGARFGEYKTHPEKVCCTLTANNGSSPMHWEVPRRLSEHEYIRIQTFPSDFNMTDIDAKYICGMSVPPFMMQRIALEVGRQIFNAEYDQQIVDNFKA